ncbi:MAG: hypothetical protein BWX84_03244 [Verrucomicrobia bacterium ADurb.Bin118]|nr:MAG: hypothetical protein BWX84_03244 [Verrucomicrobia bacterium ADurb.Bin118]
MFQALIHAQHILPVPHHHNPAHRFAFAVEIARAATHLRSQREVASHVFEQHGDAVCVRAHHHEAQFLQRFEETVPAHQVGGAVAFQFAAADVVVGAADGVDDPVERQVIGEQAIGVEFHLILFFKTAKGRHLGDAFNALQPVTQMPVLKRAQLGGVMLSAAIHQRVLKPPPYAAGIRAECRSDPGRQLVPQSLQVFQHA